jgi:hypothetical protein
MIENKNEKNIENFASEVDTEKENSDDKYLVNITGTLIERKGISCDNNFYSSITCSK